MLQHLALELPLLMSLSEQHFLLNVICPIFLSRRAIKAVAQNKPAAKKEIAASSRMGNIKAHRIVDKALRATICVKKKRLLRARAWIHFERSSFEHSLFGCCFFELCSIECCGCGSSNFRSSKSFSELDSLARQRHEQQQNVQQSGKERM